jgi:signal peptidase I
VFKTGGIERLPPGQFYVKRVAGEPGTHVRISDGRLYINEQQVTLSNAAGPITYDPPPGIASPPHADVTVPEACYYVIGDNSTNSLDSRFYGGVPRENVVGRVLFCYWPPKRAGWVK